jgi:hypothetical protein
MTLTEYKNLPDGMTKEEVLDLSNKCLDEAEHESVSATLEKLNILADHQWHTYELPDSMLRARLRQWLIQNWIENSQQYLESVLGLCYCFGLDKEFYAKALENYTGEHAEEFRRNFSKSDGENIDPWWSMKGN